MKLTGMYYDWVLVRKEQSKQTKTQSGLVIGTEDTSVAKGEVVQVGTGKIAASDFTADMPEVGDNILYEARNEIDLTVESEQLTLIKSNHIISSYDK